MKRTWMSLLFTGLLVVEALSQNADTLVSEGRAFLAGRDLTNANARFVAALALSPEHATANALYAMTRLLYLPSQRPLDSFFDRLGMSRTNRSLYQWTASIRTDSNGLPYAPAGMNANEAVALLRTNVLPELTAAGANLARIVNTNFLLTLSSNETTCVEVSLDFGDILMLRAALHATECLGYVVNAQNLDAQLEALHALYENQQLSIERVLVDYPQLLTFATPTDLDAAKLAFTKAVDRYQEASGYIRNRPVELPRLFNWDPGQTTNEWRFRQTLADLKRSLEGAVVLAANTNYTVLASNVFNASRPLRELLPVFRGNRFVLGSWPDPTFGAVLFGLRSDELDDSLSHILNTVPGLEFVAGLAGQPLQLLLHLTKAHGYVIEASTNLVQWEPISVFFANAGRMSFRDPAAGAFARRFYRIDDRTGNMPPPANDNFAERLSISGLPVSTVGYNANASRELGEPVWDYATAGQTVWYSWTAPNSGLVAVRALGDNRAVAVFTGSAVDSLEMVCSGWGQIMFEATVGTTYQIAVDCSYYSGYAGQNRSFELVIARPPTLTLNSPTNGAMFRAVGDVQVQGSVTRGDASISRVQLSCWGPVSLNLTLPITGSFDYWWTNLPSGNYRLYLDCQDSYGIAVQVWAAFQVVPANDNFVDRIPITGSLPVAVSGSNLGATMEPEEYYYSSYAGQTVWWSWTALESGVVTIACEGTLTNYWGGVEPYATAIGVYTGDILENLRPVIWLWPDGALPAAQVTFAATAGTTYQIVADGMGGNFRLLITSNAPPTITLVNPPDGATYRGPTNLVLTAIESAGRPLARVDFLLDGVKIGSVSNSPYTLHWSVPAADDYASYLITAQALDLNGLWGSAASSITLAPPPPPNDNFANRIALSGSSPIIVTRNNTGATVEPDEPQHLSYATNCNSVWWSWTAPVSGNVTIDCSIYSGWWPFPVPLAVYTGETLPRLSLVGSAYGDWWADRTQLSFPATAGTTYQIAVEGQSYEGEVTLSIYY